MTVIVCYCFVYRWIFSLFSSYTTFFHSVVIPLFASWTHVSIYSPHKNAQEKNVYAICIGEVCVVFALILIQFAASTVLIHDGWVWFMAFPVNRSRLNWMKIIWLTVYLLMYPSIFVYLYSPFRRLCHRAEAKERTAKKKTNKNPYTMLVESASHNKNIDSRAGQELNSIWLLWIHSPSANT